MIKEDLWGNKTLLVRMRKNELFGETFACGNDSRSTVTFHVETVVLLSQHRDKSTCLDERGSRQIEMQASRLASLLAQKPDDTIESDLDLDELDTTRAELKARD